jgi:putative SOS response-associated peptidase YedK
MINARAETLLEKNAYRSLIGRRRCLIVADGFYEWRLGSDGRTQPVRFSRLDDDPFAFAGLWTTWADRQDR